MRNTLRDLIEDHFLITIFLVSISVIIAFVVTVIGPYTSATYYPELVLSEMVIILVFISSVLVRILRHFYWN